MHRAIAFNNIIKESFKDINIRKIKTILKNADTILVFAGAGMSADSGLATYKDKEGFLMITHCTESLRETMFP